VTKTSPASDDVPPADGPAAALSDEAIELLVDQALTDRALKDSAWSVNLRREQVLRLAQSQQTHLADVPLALSGTLAQRRRELDAITAGRERRTRVLKVMTVAVILALWILAVGAFVVADRWLGFEVSVWWIPAIVVGVVVVGLLSWWVYDQLGWQVYHGSAVIDKATAAVDSARGDIDEFRVGEIAKRLRLEINSRQQEHFRTVMADVESRGLAEIEDPRNLIATEARRRLDRLLREMPGGSIGLSGPRGAGKSSLIRATCPSGDDQPPGLLGIVVDAPVGFEPREFVLHLFAELCRAILGSDAVERLRRPDPFLRASGGVQTSRLVVPLIPPTLLLVGLAMFLVNVAGVDPGLMWSIVVTLSGLVGFWLVRRLRFRYTDDREPYRERFYAGVSGHERQQRFRFVYEMARDRLSDIWFQQSFTTGWSGALKLPIGLEGGLSGSRELARQQLSMPDVVGELRRMVRALTEVQRESDAPPLQVRIGIDELDKIGLIDDARTFLNEIKVLFGIPRCFFLVSLSEDAMSDFERRGLPMRDVFDSSFDDVVRVPPLDAATSIALLRERTIGMPVPFMLLCHAMAGGLPRDVIRVAREILPDDDAEHQLSDVAGRLVATQIAAKVDATLVASRRLPRTAELEGFQDWLQEVHARRPDASGLLSTCQEDRPGLRAALYRWPEIHGSKEAVTDLPGEMLGYCYFCATVLDVFTDNQPAAAQRPGSWEHDGEPLADELAEAQRAFAVHSRAAWEATSRVRTRIGVQTLPPYPEPVAAVAHDAIPHTDGADSSARDAPTQIEKPRGA
jgi:hypothetical protein